MTAAIDREKLLRRIDFAQSLLSVVRRSDSGDATVIDARCPAHTEDDLAPGRLVVRLGRLGNVEHARCRDGCTLEAICNALGAGENVDRLIAERDAEKERAIQEMAFLHDIPDNAWSGADSRQAFESGNWIVDGLLSTAGAAWLYGLPGSYKSFVALDMALHVAAGKAWMGRPVERGLVVYVAAEGGHDVHLRRRAWEVRHGVRAPVAIVECAPQMDVWEGTDSGEYSPGVRDLSNAIARIRRAAADHAGVLPEKLPPVRLVVIDTYNQTSSGASLEAVNAYFKGIKALIRRAVPSAAVLVVDHTDKGGSTFLGSVAKLGNCDMMAKVEKDGQVATITMAGGAGKVKGAPDFSDIHLAMELQETDWKGKHGNTLSTLVCTDGNAAASRQRIANGSAAAALLLELIGDGTSAAALREAFIQHPNNAGKERETVTRAYRRAIGSLEDSGAVIIAGDLVRVAK